MRVCAALTALTALCTGAPQTVHAQEPEAVSPAAAATTPAAPASAVPGAAARAWEGAIGLNASYRREYSGASSAVFKLTPALFLRYGRFSVTNTAGLVPRGADDVVRGLGLDLVRSDTVRVSTSLRLDPGRGDGTPALAGMGSIRSTLRGRVAASYRWPAGVRLGTSFNADLMGRGGGHYGDASLAQDHKLTPTTALTLGSSLSVGSRRYLQSHYGVTPEQAANSLAHHAVFTPRAGLRDAALFAALRHDVGHDWTLLAGASATQLLGQAADSPLTQRRAGWSANAGFARRF